MFKINAPDQFEPIKLAGFPRDLLIATPKAARQDENFSPRLSHPPPPTMSC